MKPEELVDDIFDINVGIVWKDVFNYIDNIIRRDWEIIGRGKRRRIHCEFIDNWISQKFGIKYRFMPAVTGIILEAYRNAGWNVRTKCGYFVCIILETPISGLESRVGDAIIESGQKFLYEEKLINASV